ncbi:pyridoxamine 5'-phosphate oxidase family protein [Rhodohalobacter mucosus]|uniref:Pyridoxamine 5'-phosphate oxidase Alr4036 family FMN-binding domain-containing protein n=1 Tax=Rhodohalobacter mucosus TaxID=2079485 RepID=A0A316TNF5_9BACT|nr:pyridoxamine 5'-phosphate oxidase family protein [Rhodohalobacter mucosus]PWN06133.1 hypothetical protein DDZ15_09820 [Rhodohalobacter mucosus]
MSREQIITQEISLNEAWERVMGLVCEAAAGGSHPFRYVTLATVDEEKSPQQRMVVLRDFEDASIFTVYTDCRSDKTSQIAQNDSVSLLFYHGEKRLQLRVTGKAEIVNTGEEHARRWKNDASTTPEPYSSVVPPGEEIEHPEEAYEWDLEGAPNFCIIKIRAFHMEFLQLDGVKHIRGMKRNLSDGKKTVGWISP